MSVNVCSGQISGQTGWYHGVDCSCLRSDIDVPPKVWVANLMAKLRVVQSTDCIPINIIIIVKNLTADISIYIQYRPSCYNNIALPSKLNCILTVTSFSEIIKVFWKSNYLQMQLNN